LVWHQHHAIRAEPFHAGVLVCAHTSAPADGRILSRLVVTHDHFPHESSLVREAILHSPLFSFPGLRFASVASRRHKSLARWPEHDFVAWPDYLLRYPLPWGYQESARFHDHRHLRHVGTRSPIRCPERRLRHHSRFASLSIGGFRLRCPRLLGRSHRRQPRSNQQMSEAANHALTSRQAPFATKSRVHHSRAFLSLPGRRCRPCLS